MPHNHERGHGAHERSRWLSAAGLVLQLAMCPGDDILAIGTALLAPIAHVAVASIQQDEALPEPNPGVVIEVDGTEIPRRWLDEERRAA